MYMALIFAVDGDNDLVVRGARITVKIGLEAVLQQCEHALKTQLGELIFDTTRGLPNFDSVWSGNVNALAFEQNARSQLQRIPDVIGIEALQVERQQHTLIYRAVITTRYGTGTITNNPIT